MSKIFFVTGFARSGTTLLATLLGRHPSICATPETCFFEHIYRKDGKPNKDKVEKSRFYSDLNINSKNTLDYKSYKSLFDSALACFNNENKEIIVEKSPHHLAFIPTILREYPNTRIVIIVRDPRDIYCSLKEVRWAHSSALRHASEWQARHEQLTRCIQKYRKSLLVIKYENLITNTKDVLEEICSFYGIEFHQEMLDSQSATTVPNWESEWKGRVTKPIDTSRVGRYKTIISPKELTTINCIAKDAEIFGYEIDCRTQPIWQSIASAILKSQFYRNTRLLFRRGQRYDFI